MRNKMLLMCLFTFLYVGLQAADLKVVSATPQGEGAANRGAVSVTFNQPVAALSENNAFAAKDCPLHITPAVKGTCRFAGTQTLEFEPEAAWATATQYTVTLPGTFTSQVSKQALGEEYTFRFVTSRPAVEGIIPTDQEQWIDVRSLIFVTLSQPVDLASAQQAAQLSYEIAQVPQLSWWERLKAFVLQQNIPTSTTGTVPVSVRGLTDEEYKNRYEYMQRDHIFVLVPQADLPPAARVTVKLSAQLRGQEGPLGLQQAFSSLFYTYPKLEMVGGNTSGCLPFDAYIDFTSPVRLQELMKHISVYPASALAEVTEQEAQTLGYQRFVPREDQNGGDTDEDNDARPYPNLAPGTGYFEMPLAFLRLDPKKAVTVTIDKDLTDIYGQKLGQEKVFHVSNNGYCPAVVFKGGTGVLESYLPLRHPIDVLNEKALDVVAARFGKESFIPFYTKNINYCQQAEIDAARVQFSGEYPFSITPDQTKKTYLDLKKFNPTAHDSVIYSQVRVPSKYQKDGYCWVGALDNITDLGVTFKASAENSLIWVTSLQTGEPQANLNVELRDEANHTLWSGSTDADGLAKAPGVAQLQPYRRNKWSRPVLYAFVSSAGGDAVVSSEWNDGMEAWRFNLNYNYQFDNDRDDIKTALFTDRGIYRPGETLYFKGITRQMKNGAWTLPSFTKGTLKVFNSRGDEVTTQNITYRAQTGAFSGEIALPKDAPTGSWQLHFVPDQASDEADTLYSFRVEAVKQADFDVHVRSLQPNYLSGQKAEFTASADYLFGAPVAGGKVKWSVRRSEEYFEAKDYPDYIFSPYFLYEQEPREDGLLTESSAELDAQGKINFAVNLPKVSRRQGIYTEVGVQAPTGQQLFARTHVTVNPADFYLGAYMERWAAELGDKVQADIAAVDVNGQAFGPVEVEAKIQKEEYYSIRKNGLAGRLEWVSQRNIKDIATQHFTVEQTGYKFNFVPQQPGNYQIILTAKDAQGRSVRGGFEVMVYGKGKAYWKQNDDDILILKQDKDLYQPGESARILVQSPYEQATALVTVERSGVLDSWVTTVPSGAGYIDVPIKDAYVPNVYVSVMLVRGRAAQPAYDEEGLDLAKPQAKLGYAQLTISQQEREIQTTVKPARENYRPGEEVSVKLSTSLQGKAVPAEVTVMAVDEGVLNLTAYKLPNIMGIFYAPFPLAVHTADNHPFLIGQRNFGEKGENRGGGGGFPNKLGGVDLRSRFEFTPYFNATVQTDNKGRADVKFKLPDNLTTFRIMAVAATVQEFGAAEATIKVSKPLMITANMPRFARQGDQFRCGAVVYNYEDEKGLITVSATATGALKLTGGAQEIQVAKGQAGEVSWPCEATATGAAQVAFTAKGAKDTDGVQTKLEVMNIEKPQTLALYSATDAEQAQVLEKPASAKAEADNQVKLSLASTALLNLRGSMLYLLTYPYDCLEQKMSKIIPVIEGSELVRDFDLGDSKTYQAQAREILQEIGSYQTSSGGLSYWPGLLPDAYVTAYTLETAYRAKQAGYSVPDSVLKQAVKWLKGVFADKLAQAYSYSVTEQRTMRAYAVYVLSLYGEKMDGQFNNLYTQRNSLSTSAQAYLLLAAQAMGKGADVQKTLAQALLNHAQYGDQTLHFAQTQRQPWLHENDVQATALVLRALLQAGDYLPQPYQVVRWLVDQLNAQGHWNDTHSNAAVFSALRVYYTRQEASVPDFRALVFLNHKNAFTADFEGRSLRAQETAWPFKNVYAAGDRVPVQVRKEGKGTVYYTLSQTYLPQQYTQAVSSGFSLSRKITDMQGKPASTLQSGQRYQVTLKVSSAASRTFVVVEDFLPAGFEIVNTDLATENQLSAPDEPENTPFERNEKYDDRLAVFAGYLPAGDHEYTYVVQALAPGKYSYPSLWASQMYEPSVFGRTATTEIEINK